MPADVPPAAIAATSSVEYYSSADSKAPYSPAVRVGDLVFLSGQIGMDINGAVPDGMEAQARLALDNVKKVAGLAGLGMSHIVKCTVMLTDMRHWGVFNEVYKSYFAAGKLPARSAFGVSELALGAVVEVECIALANPK